MTSLHEDDESLSLQLESLQFDGLTIMDITVSRP